MRLLCLLGICSLVFAASVSPTESDFENTDCVYNDGGAVIQSLFGVSWSFRAPTPSDPVSRCAGAWGSDGKFHLLCGNCSAHTSHPTDEVWDPIGDTWTTGLSRPGSGIHNHCAAAMGSKIYVGGGSNPSGYSDDFTCIDLGANTWTTIGTMPVSSLLYYELTALDGKVYMFGGGIQGTNITDQAWVYDTAAGTWTQLANMPIAMRDVMLGGVGDTIYIAGGCNVYSTGLNTLYKYSISGDDYTSGPNMPSGMFWGVGDIVPHADSGGQLVVMGGMDGSSYRNYVYRYNILGGYWVTETPFSTGRRSHAGAISSDGFLYVACGWNGGFLNTLEEGIPDWPGVEESEGYVTVPGRGTVVASPNPFRGQTTVSYQIPSSQNVNMGLYDISGKLVMSIVAGRQSAGSHHVDLDLRSLAAGVYIVRLDHGAQSEITKLVITK